MTSAASESSTTQVAGGPFAKHVYSHKPVRQSKQGNTQGTSANTVPDVEPIIPNSMLSTDVLPQHQNSAQWWRRNWFIILPLVVNLLTYAILFPGIDSPDAATQREQYATWTFNKQHSILDTFFLGFIGRNQLWLDNLLQVLIFSACIITALYSLSIRTNRRTLLIATLVWSIFPLFPAYAVSSTKDVLCAGFTLLLCTAIFSIIDSRGNRLRNPWFLLGLGILLFVTNEYRKNNFIFIIAILVFLCIHYRHEWKQVLTTIAIFATLTAGWGAYCNIGLRATPSPTTEMLGVPLMQISYIYYQNENGNPQHLPQEADQYFQSLRPAQDWAQHYEVERLFVMTNKVESLKSKDLKPFLQHWSSLCFANLGTCVKAYLLFEGSLLNPLQETDDQYSILAGAMHTTKAEAAQSALAIVPRIVFNLAIFDWMLIALAVLTIRNKRKELLPLFLIPLGILISIMLAALAVQIRLMLGGIILIPFLAALILNERSNGITEDFHVPIGEDTKPSVSLPDSERAEQ